MITALIGPCDGDLDMLSAALRWLLFVQKVDRCFYFGAQAEAADCLTILGGDAQVPESILDAATELALLTDDAAASSAIDQLLQSVNHAERLATVHTVPETPKKHIEMVRNRLMVVTRDHKHLGEDDIANATLIVYTNNKQSVFKRFGKRAFFAPPPLNQGAVGLVVANGPQVDLAVQTLHGEITWREPIMSPKTKMTVT